MLIGENVEFSYHVVRYIYIVFFFFFSSPRFPLSCLSQSGLTTLGAIFTPTLAAVPKISLGSFRQFTYLRLLQLFLLAERFATARQSHLQFSLHSPTPSPVLLFDQGFCPSRFYWFYTDAMGMSEKQGPREKVRSQMKNMNISLPSSVC